MSEAKSVDIRPRCENPKCGAHERGKKRGAGRVLAEKLTRPWTVVCPRCGWRNAR